MFGFVFIILDIQVALDQLGNWARFWWILCSDRDLRFAFLHSKRLDAYKNISFRSQSLAAKLDIKFNSEFWVPRIHRHIFMMGHEN